jgi:hypothetical protein
MLIVDAAEEVACCFVELPVQIANAPMAFVAIRCSFVHQSALVHGAGLENMDAEVTEHL